MNISRRTVGFAGIILLFLLAAWVVGVEGDFPLNDDWHYGRLVKALYEDGYFHFPDEISPNMLWQPFWGYVFCGLWGGFSFTALRISTLVLGGVGLVLIYCLLRIEKAPRSKAWFGMLAFGFSPVFFSLSFTFMTDVPFLTLMLACWLAFRAYLKTEKEVYRWLGYLFAIGAYGMRMPGILLIPAFELAFFLSKDRKARPVGRLLFGIFGSLVFLIVTEEIIKPELGLRSIFRSGTLVWEDRKEITLYDNVYLRSGLGIYGNLGFWLLPLAPLILRKWGATPMARRKANLPLFLAVNFLLTLLLAWAGKIFPYISGGNIFYNFGLGPLLLTDVRYWGWPSGLELPSWIMILIGTLSQSLLCIALYLVWRELQAQKGKNPYFVFIGFFCAGYLAMVCSYSFFDRYLLPVFCALILFFLTEVQIRIPRRSTAFLLLMTGWLAVAGTRDYLAMNRKVYALYTEAWLERGGNPQEIDGGVPLNGFFTGATLKPDARKILTMSVRDESRVEQAETWFSWLHVAQKKVYLTEP